jgi:hemolysin activation/secretion protein
MCIPTLKKCSARPAVLAIVLAATSLMAASSAQAQTPPVGAGDALRQSEQTRRAAPQARPAMGPVLPRLTEPQLRLKDKETLFVRSFRLEGAELIDEAQARALLAPYEGRKLTIAQIHEAADQITALYRNRGYLVAKAYIPAQDARRGVLLLKIVPGRYGKIEARNESLVRQSVVDGFVDRALHGESTIHKDALERAMLLISDLPGAGVPRITVEPGRQPMTSDFAFAVPQVRRLDGYLLGDNYGSPLTGRNRLSGGVNWNSPLGIGDRLSAFGIVTKDANLLNGRAAYSLPIGYSGLRAEVAAFRTTYVLGGIYKALESTGTADGLTASLTYPLRRLRDDSIYLSGTYTHKALEDRLLGISFSERRIDSGTAAITRDTVSALFGLPLTTSATLAFTAGDLEFPDPLQRAINIAGPNTIGGFAKLALSLNATFAFNEKLSLSVNFRGQKSFSGNLDSSEQMGLTGYWGVRSYDEGLAGDSGYLVTPELKFALPDIQRYRHAFGLFADVGAVRLEDPSYTVTQNARTQLSAIGAGYYATYEVLPGQVLLIKAQVAHTVGSDQGAQSYNRSTKALLQAGFTF